MSRHEIGFVSNPMNPSGTFAATVSMSGGLPVTRIEGMPGFRLAASRRNSNPFISGMIKSETINFGVV